MQTVTATSTMMGIAALEEKYQDSNGDGKPCNPGDFGVDEDFSEVELTNLINNREIYLIPLLNTDGFIYDQTVFLSRTGLGILPEWWMEKEFEK